MARLLNEKRYQADMAELEAYRSTSLSPKEVCRLMVYSTEPAPLPLPFHDDDDFSLGAGLLVDDEYDPALFAAQQHDQGRWDK
jgi:hypothetical protein